MDYAAEASDLGFPPGQWPKTVVYKGQTFTKGDPKFDAEGDLQLVVYRNGAAVLKVFND